MRTAYAIEYDCCDPHAASADARVHATSRGCTAPGSSTARSGYEEAAAQGLVAGVNAAHAALGRGELVLLRSEAYIGALIDDLVTKGTNEPYRIMTSRS